MCIVDNYHKTKFHSALLSIKRSQSETIHHYIKNCHRQSCYHILNFCNNRKPFVYNGSIFTFCDTKLWHNVAYKEVLFIDTNYNYYH